MKERIFSNSTASELGQERLRFGKKHRNKTLWEIYEEDRAYIEYMADEFWKEIKDIPGRLMTEQQRFKLRFITFWQKVQDLEERSHA